MRLPILHMPVMCKCTYELHIYIWCQARIRPPYNNCKESADILCKVYIALLYRIGRADITFNIDAYPLVRLTKKVCALV